MAVLQPNDSFEVRLIRIIVMIMNKLTGNLVYLYLRFNGSKYFRNYGFSFEVILGTFFLEGFCALHFPNYYLKDFFAK